MKAITIISRLLVGFLFIFSGFIKANDPIGFSYKLAEYFDLFGMPALADAALPLAIIICVLEILLGVDVLISAQIRITSWLLLLMIIFFTWLTGYSAVTNKVTDCGCFGDAIKLTPWQSFSKDIVLLVFILIIFIRRNHIKPLFSKPFGNKTLIISTVISTVFSVYCWYYLPVIDFLYWKEGNDVKKLMELPPDAKRDSIVMNFIYERDGKRYEFTTEELMKLKDLGSYKYIDRQDKVIRKGDVAPIHDFSVANRQGVDVTDSLFARDEYKLVLVSYNLEMAHTSAQPKINDLARNWIDQHNLQFWALTATPPEDAERLRHEWQAPYPFYNSDGTALKAIIRSNPGLLLMKKSTVIKKWPSTRIPDYEDVHKYMK